MEVLCQRANHLWPVIEQQVESKGWSWASVKAQKVTEQSDLLLGSGTKTEFTGYAIGFKKDEYGNWVNVGDKCSQNYTKIRQRIGREHNLKLTHRIPSKAYVVSRDLIDFMLFEIEPSE